MSDTRIKRLEALSLTARFLYSCAYGYKPTAHELKTFADMCFLTLPMKHRMNREELERRQRGWG